MLFDDAAIEERNDRQAAAENDGASLQKEPEDRPELDRARRGHEQRHAGQGRRRPRRSAPNHPDSEGRENDDPNVLGASRHDDGEICRADDPEQNVSPQRPDGEAVSRSGDDRDDGGAGAVERACDPGQAAGSGVDRRRDHHHDERRSDERGGGDERPGQAGPQPADVHRQLRRQRARRELGKGQGLLEPVLAEPAPLGHQVPAHPFGERDGATEAGEPEAQEVSPCFGNDRLIVSLHG